MKRFMVMGKSGGGKTSLLQRVYGEKMADSKTQTVESFGASIDTPGEYLEMKSLYSALIVTAVDCDELLLIQAADDPDSSFPPELGVCFNRDVTGVVTKMDLVAGPEQAEAAAECLRTAGAERIFYISAKTGAGLSTLRAYMLR